MECEPVRQIAVLWETTPPDRQNPGNPVFRDMGIHEAFPGDRVIVQEYDDL